LEDLDPGDNCSGRGIDWWYSHYLSQQAKRLTDKDTIVLADFANSTGDPVFDDTLKTALNVSLRQSPFLNVLSESEVAKTLQQMTRPASTRLTPEWLASLPAGAQQGLPCRSDWHLGSEYVLGLKAVNCQNGDTLAQEQVTAAAKEKYWAPWATPHPNCAANSANRSPRCRNSTRLSLRPPHLLSRL